MNLSTGRGPGTMVAGLFLQHFVDEKQPWLHIDIGASGFVERDLTFSKKGATGLGLRLLVDLVETYEK
nr:hypothetical protein [Candidatus Venteria ishoeyi]